MYEIIFKTNGLQKQRWVRAATQQEAETVVTDEFTTASIVSVRVVSVEEQDAEWSDVWESTFGYINKA